MARIQPFKGAAVNTEVHSVQYLIDIREMNDYIVIVVKISKYIYKI
ncbi:MAG: hypothetical protein GF353_02675 [Candidatus Lokiarchaeota archaeon]|nr:hypothetical protein [Candidatus Lokiarchaeota archaeon]